MRKSASIIVTNESTPLQDGMPARSGASGRPYDASPLLGCATRSVHASRTDLRTVLAVVGHDRIGSAVRCPSLGTSRVLGIPSLSRGRKSKSAKLWGHCLTLHHAIPTRFVWASCRMSKFEPESISCHLRCTHTRNVEVQNQAMTPNICGMLTSTSTIKLRSETTSVRRRDLFVAFD